MDFWELGIFCVYFLTNNIINQAKWLSLREMEPVTRVQILDEVVYVLLRTNTFRKGMNPLFLPASYGKIEQARFFWLGLATRIGEGKLNSNQFYSVQKLISNNIQQLGEVLDTWSGDFFSSLIKVLDLPPRSKRIRTPFVLLLFLSN